jgi:hypothetical protein
MRIEDFENQAKKAFESYTPAEDHDTIWANIEPHLRKRRKRRFIFWLFWGIAGLGAWWAWPRHASVVPDQPLAQLVAKGTNTVVQGTTVPTATKPVFTAQVPKKAAPVVTNVSQKTEQRSTRASSPVLQPEKGANFSVNSAASNNAVAPVAVADIAAKTGVSAVENATALKTGEHTTPNPPALTAIVPLSQDVTPEKPVLSPVATGPITASTLPTNAPVAPSPTAAIETQSISTAENQPKTPQKIKKSATKAKKKRRIQKKMREGHSVGLAAGGVMPVKMLALRNNNTEYASLLQSRKETEQSLEGIAAAMQYQWTAPNNWFVRGGLTYHRLNERFSIQFMEEGTRQVQGIVSITVDGQDNVLRTTTGNKTQQYSRTYDNVTYNSYTFLDIPVGVGHRNKHKRWNLEWALGLNVNLLSRFEGTLMHTSGTPQTRFSPPVFKERYGLGCWANFGFSRPIAAHWRWIASVNAAAPLQSITAPDYAITQRYFLPGLQTGMVYDCTANMIRKRKKR